MIVPYGALPAAPVIGAHIVSVINAHRAFRITHALNPSNTRRMEPSERLQNILARSGLSSRRGAAQLIEAGRVRVDGHLVTTPGTRVDPAVAAISLDGTAIPRSEPLRTLMLNKPPGYICSTQASQGRTVYALIPHVSERVLPVGRLDKESEGLLLMSNDGALIQALTHPRHGHTKQYRVRVTGLLTPETIASLRAPIEIDGYLTRPATVAVVRQGNGEHELAFTLMEGRNRQIRRLCGRARLEVTRLIRTAIQSLELNDLPSGASRDLTTKEDRALRDY